MMKSRWLVTCATAMMALTISTAFAKAAVAAPSPRQHDEGRGQSAAHMKFNDNDRQASRTWYDGHHSNLPVGLRDTDRMTPATESQFKEGWVIDKATRKNVHAVPSTLLKVLAPAPRNYRYVAVGGYVALVDGNYRISDVMTVRHER
jgi:Ni/Co efflux regulator RcnB